MNSDTTFNNLTKNFFVNKFIDFELEHIFGFASVNKSKILRNRSVEDNLTESAFEKFCINFAVNLFCHTDFDGCVKTQIAFIISHHSFINISEYLAVTLCFGFNECKVVRTENHILCGNNNGLTIRRFKEVVCSKHKESCFRLSFCRKRYVNSHLVTVEVGVESCTYKRMKLNSSTFNKYGLESLNTKSVKSRSTVEHYGVVFNNNFESIPNFNACSFNHFSCRFNVICFTKLAKSLHYEGLEKLDCHFLGKTALIELKLGTNNDNGTTRIVNTFTEKVLTETTLLTFKHIGK